MTTLRAAIYIRQSRYQEGTVSEELQETNCRKLAEKHGWEVVGVHKDIDLSGASTVKRDGLRDLRAEYAAGNFDIAIADDLSRFSRSVADSSVIRAEMPTATWKEGVQDNQLFADLLSAFNADYLRQISARWDDALTRRLKAGLPPSGRKQFGYDKVNGHYVINETEAAIVREAYERYTAGVGARTICEDFTRRELPAAGPAGWYPLGFFELLDKVFYSGKIAWNGVEVQGAHEPLISPTEWAAYRKAREARKSQAKPRNPKWHLAGIVRCGLCGGVMVSHRSSRGIDLLSCSTYNNQGKAGCEGVFRKRTVVATRVAVWLGAHLQEWADALPTDDEAKLAAETAVAEAQEAAVSAQKNLDGLLERAIRLDLSDEVIAASLTKFKDELAQAKHALEDAQAELGALTPAETVHEQIMQGSALMGFSEDPDEVPSEEATARYREALSKIIEKVVILPTEGSNRDPKRDHRKEIIIVPR